MSTNKKINKILKQLPKKHQDAWWHMYWNSNERKKKWLCDFVLSLKGTTLKYNGRTINI